MALSEDRVTRARLSAQRALLGEVSPALRAVVLGIAEAEIEVRCYFDGVVSSGDEESVSCLETEMLADFDSDESVIVKPIRLDAPVAIQDDGVWVYFRRESM